MESPFHQKIDSWLLKHIGKGAVKVKEFFGQIFHLVFITLVMEPIYKVMRWLVSFGVEWYGRRVGRLIALGRTSLVETEINANLLYNMADKFKELYPVPAKLKI